MTYNKKVKRKCPGVIEASKGYTASEFCRVLAITWETFRGMRQRGLRVCKDGRRVMVRGMDYLNYLDTLPGDEESPEIAPTNTPDGSPDTAAHAEAVGSVATEGH